MEVKEGFRRCSEVRDNLSTVCWGSVQQIECETCPHLTGSIFGHIGRGALWLGQTTLNPNRKDSTSLWNGKIRLVEEGFELIAFVTVDSVSLASDRLRSLDCRVMVQRAG